ncbi:MAG TPA: diguanylate cyclase [Steroidobacteraceae bacterium]|nr:diguanylate cyclase [Steroidobacteraceae bacterium]
MSRLRRLTMLAHKLYDPVRAPLRVDGHDLEVCASIGIAIAPDDGQNADELMRHADPAMYRAKRQGTGLEFYSANHAASAAPRIVG